MEVRLRRPSVINDLSRFVHTRGDDREQLEALRDLYSISRGDDVMTEVIRACGHEMFGAIDAVERQPAVPSRNAYPSSALGQSLRSVAAILDAHPETQFAWVTTGGYDTHAGQNGEHAHLLSALASAIAAFQTDLEARKIDHRVLLMAWSEFGRRVAENASGGTDHGKAGIVFVAGTGVRGGLWGEPPDLGRLDDGDLPSRVDFRSVYSTLIRRWLDRDPQPVLGKRFPLLGFI
jgi:uncharacterized protein (DUF1501 family)